MSAVVISFVLALGTAVVSGAALIVVQPSLGAGAAVWWAVAAGLAEALGTVLIFRALAVGPMSLASPIIGSGAAIPVVAGILAGDDLSTLQAVGVGLTLAGLIAVCRTQ